MNLINQFIIRESIEYTYNTVSLYNYIFPRDREAKVTLRRHYSYVVHSIQGMVTPNTTPSHIDLSTTHGLALSKGTNMQHHINIMVSHTHKQTHPPWLITSPTYGHT